MLKGAVDGVSDDEAQAAATLAAIQAFAKARPMIYLPAHDPQAARRLAERRPVGLRQSVTAADFHPPSAQAAFAGGAPFVWARPPQSG